jgi:hypothetical protein
MPIFAGFASTVGLIVALSGLADPMRHWEASRALRIGGWVLAGLSMLLALTSVLPAGLTASTGDYTRTSSQLCDEVCQASAARPTLSQGSAVSSLGYPGNPVFSSGAGPTGTGQ